LCWLCPENESPSPYPRAFVGTAEEAIREAARALIGKLNGQLGKVLSELIAEGQSEPAILQELFDKHIRGHQEANFADIDRQNKRGASQRCGPGADYRFSVLVRYFIAFCSGPHR
jgi:hypothetical protein